jgi:hypothetical protein
VGTEVRKKCVRCGQLKDDEHPKGKFFHTENLYILGWWCADCLKNTPKEQIDEWVKKRTEEVEGKYDMVFEHYRKHLMPYQDD